MDILGGDKIRTKSAKSKQCRAGCAFGCTLRLYAGLCLAVLTLSQPDAQPALCREPTGCSPVEDKAMKCPSSYPLVLRRKDDSVVHVNMPCNRWTCAVCRQRKLAEWSRHASRCFQSQEEMSWATCPIDAVESLNRFILRHECERMTVQQDKVAVVFVNKRLRHPKIEFHPISPEDAAGMLASALALAKFARYGHPITTSRSWKRRDDKDREFEYIAGGVSREQFTACAEHLEVPVKTKNIHGADVAIAVGDERKLDSLCSLLIKCPRKHQWWISFNSGKADKYDLACTEMPRTIPKFTNPAACCT